MTTTASARRRGRCWRRRGLPWGGTPRTGRRPGRRRGGGRRLWCRWVDPRGWVADLVTGWAMMGCGLAGWARRPDSGSGALLAAAGFAWFAPDFAASGVGPVGWLGAQALYLHRGPLVQLVLTYPRGRVRGPLAGAPVAAGDAAAGVTPVWGRWAGPGAPAACPVPRRERGRRR